MKIMLISNDRELINTIQDTPGIANLKLEVVNNFEDPLDILSTVYTSHPRLLIIDDDYLKPQSEQIIKAIKKVNRDIGLIFITSNTSIELGKEVSQQGLFYYAIKPVKREDLHDSLNSIFAIIQRDSVKNHQLN